MKKFDGWLIRKDSKKRKNTTSSTYPKASLHATSKQNKQGQQTITKANKNKDDNKNIKQQQRTTTKGHRHPKTTKKNDDSTVFSVFFF